MITIITLLTLVSHFYFLVKVAWNPGIALYPVMVFLHGGDFLYGTGQQYPGHVLAAKGVVVVTLNYRLGALGQFYE